MRFFKVFRFICLGIGAFFSLFAILSGVAVFSSNLEVRNSIINYLSSDASTLSYFITYAFISVSHFVLFFIFNGLYLSRRPKKIKTPKAKPIFKEKETKTKEVKVEVEENIDKTITSEQKLK